MRSALSGNYAGPRCSLSLHFVITFDCISGISHTGHSDNIQALNLLSTSPLQSIRPPKILTSYSCSDYSRIEWEGANRRQNGSPVDGGQLSAFRRAAQPRWPTCGKSQAGAIFEKARRMTSALPSWCVVARARHPLLLNSPVSCMNAINLRAARNGCDSVRSIGLVLQAIVCRPRCYLVSAIATLGSTGAGGRRPRRRSLRRGSHPRYKVKEEICRFAQRYIHMRMQRVCFSVCARTEETLADQTGLQGEENTIDIDSEPPLSRSLSFWCPFCTFLHRLAANSPCASAARCWLSAPSSAAAPAAAAVEPFHRAAHVRSALNTEAGRVPPNHRLAHNPFATSASGTDTDARSKRGLCYFFADERLPRLQSGQRTCSLVGPSLVSSFISAFFRGGLGFPS